MRAGTWFLAVVTAVVLSGTAAADDGAPYRLLGGTWNNAPGVVIGTNLAIESPAAGGAITVGVSGPPGWGLGMILCGGYQPPGVAANRALCWTDLLPLAGEYTAVSLFGGEAGPRVVSIDPSSTLAPPDVVLPFDQTADTVTVNWIPAPEISSYLIRLNRVPWDFVIVKEIAIPAGATSVTLSDLSLAAGQLYQLTVWGFSGDITSPAPIFNPFNLSSDGLFFLPDTSPPLVDPVVDGTLGRNGWYTSNVGIQWNASDPDSGLSGLSSGCTPLLWTVDTTSATLTCRAINGGLQLTERTVTFKKDATPPAIHLVADKGQYDVDETIMLSCDAADLTSGIDSLTCPAIATPAWTVPLGTHTFSARADDRAGNSASRSIDVTVGSTASGVCRLAAMFAPSLGAALCSKLEPGPTSEATAGRLRAFANQVEAQRGKALTSAEADALLRAVAGL